MYSVLHFITVQRPKRKQQIGEIIGVVATALVIGGVFLLLDSAWGFGSPELAAPQAMLMKVITEGVMSGNIPWKLVFIGAFIAVVIEMLGISALAVAIGLYLPLELSTPIMLGGLLRWFVDRKKSGKDKQDEASGGILFSSGLIAGEGLMGILLAFFAILGIDKMIDLSNGIDLGVIGAIALLVLLLLLMFLSAHSRKKSK